MHLFSGTAVIYGMHTVLLDSMARRWSGIHDCSLHKSVLGLIMSKLDALSECKRFRSLYVAPKDNYDSLLFTLICPHVATCFTGSSCNTSMASCM